MYQLVFFKGFGCILGAYRTAIRDSNLMLTGEKEKERRDRKEKKKTRRELRRMKGSEDVDTEHERTRRG